MKHGNSEEDDNDEKKNGEENDVSTENELVFRMNNSVFLFFCSFPITNSITMALNSKDL